MRLLAVAGASDGMVSFAPKKRLGSIDYSHADGQQRAVNKGGHPPLALTPSHSEAPRGETVAGAGKRLAVGRRQVIGRRQA